VALYRSRPGTSIAEIADDVGVNWETLRSWVRADDQRRGGSGRSTAATLAPGSVEAENAESRRRVEAQGVTHARPTHMSTFTGPSTHTQRLRERLPSA
jgi:transposase-like protein